MRIENKKLCRSCFNKAGYVWHPGAKGYWGKCHLCERENLELRRESDV